jgi:hypothetical protein
MEYKRKNKKEKEGHVVINDMLSTGIIRANNSPFSSPVRVKKEDGSWHGLILHSIKIGRNKKLHPAYFLVEMCVTKPIMHSCNTLLKKWKFR